MQRVQMILIHKSYIDEEMYLFFYIVPCLFVLYFYTCLPFSVGFTLNHNNIQNVFQRDRTEAGRKEEEETTTKTSI